MDGGTESPDSAPLHSGQQRDDDLKRFAYAASHDLQSSLRTITAHLQLLERRLGNRLAPEDRELLRFPVDAALRMSRLIKDLLTYSQMSAGELVLAPICCEEVLVWSLHDLTAVIAESHAAVTHDPLPVLLSDAVRLRQLFRTLIGNAIQYRRTEPLTIHIAARHEHGNWHFSISDNGLGVSAEHWDDIFKPFRRLQAYERPGSGLGLATSKRILERLAGRIWVESQVGVGSTFHFTIPDVQSPERSDGTVTDRLALQSPKRSAGIVDRRGP